MFRKHKRQGCQDLQNKLFSQKFLNINLKTINYEIIFVLKAGA